MKVKIASFLSLVLLLMISSSCSDSKTYAELLEAEQNAINKYLSNQQVIKTIPSDTIFITGENAPYYLIEDGVYMQVIKPGDQKDKIKKGELVYFRYVRTNLLRWAAGSESEGDAVGNMDSGSSWMSFKYGSSSTPTYGLGIEDPLIYVGRNAEVKLIIPSKVGFKEEINSVTPFLYRIKYIEGL